MSAQDVVKDFLEKMEDLDLDSAIELMSEDCVYKNMPFHVARGKPKINRDLKAMMKRVSEFKVDMLHITSDGESVLTERIDTIGIGKTKVGIELMGVFVVKDGQITEWRDYFDWGSTGGRFIKKSFMSIFS